MANDDGHHHNGGQADARNDDAVLERLSRAGHEEEVGPVDEEEHRAGGCLETDRDDGENGTTEIGPSEHIPDGRSLGVFLFNVPGFLDFLKFFRNQSFMIPAATESSKGNECLLFLAVGNEPSRGIRDEWRDEGEEDRDDEEEAEGDLIAKS